MTHYWKRKAKCGCRCQLFAVINGVAMEYDCYSDNTNEFRNNENLIYLGESTYCYAVACQLCKSRAKPSFFHDP